MKRKRAGRDTAAANGRKSPSSGRLAAAAGRGQRRGERASAHTSDNNSDNNNKSGEALTPEEGKWLQAEGQTEDDILVSDEEEEEGEVADEPQSGDRPRTWRQRDYALPPALGDDVIPVGSSSSEDENEDEDEGEEKAKRIGTNSIENSRGHGANNGDQNSSKINRQQPASAVVSAPQKLLLGPEDDEDSSEEEVLNTVGNIPMEWYKDYPHIGYSLDGEKIAKGVGKSDIRDFLEREDNPNYWRTVYDEVNDREVVLSKEEFKLLRSFQQHQLPAGADPHEAFIEYLSPPNPHPVSNRLKPKSAFVPSKWETKRINYLVQAIRKGWIKIPKKKEGEEAEDEDQLPKAFLLWEDDYNAATGDVKKPGRHLNPNNPAHPMFVAAPKPKLPTHHESYNPPIEYLPTEEDIVAWQNMDPEDRPHNFTPTKYDRLRTVPGYKNFIKERFERCLDLYLCPRVTRMRRKVVGDIDALVPKLPPRESLRPFPTKECMTFLGHTDKIRSISADPTGQWLVSGSDDQTIRLWEVETGRCLQKWDAGGVVLVVAWNPNPSLGYFVALVGKSLLFIDPGVNDVEKSEGLRKLLERRTAEAGVVTWEQPAKELLDKGVLLRVTHPHPVQTLSWHHRGDYIATVSPNSGRTSVVIHHISRQLSQAPFSKSKGNIQRVLFHPSKPFLFVATQQYIRIYNLVKQQLVKKLLPGVKWISTMDVHPGGDNIIMGSYDKKLCWFDLDLSTKPYKVLRYNQLALRRVVYHPRYPLFASCADDCRVNIFHGMVYNDLMQNPLIVPVKILKGHEPVEGLGVLDCVFHPTQPWIFSAGADASIRLFV